MWRKVQIHHPKGGSSAGGGSMVRARALLEADGADTTEGPFTSEVGETTENTASQFKYADR